MANDTNSVSPLTRQVEILNSISTTTPEVNTQSTPTQAGVAITDFQTPRTTIEPIGTIEATRARIKIIADQTSIKTIQTAASEAIQEKPGKNS